MGSRSPLRLVLDTNVAVSALLFERGRFVWLRHLWQSRSITPLLDTACTAEILRVLAYPKFALTRAEIEALLGTYLPYAEVVQTTTGKGDLPRCSDPDDQKFLELACAGKARVLVTGDRALLALAGSSTPFAIERPEELRQRF